MNSEINRVRMTLSDNIKSLLHSRGKSQTDMAQELEIPETTVSSWLTGKKYPRLDKIQMMADYFNVPRSAITEHQSPHNLIPVSPPTVRVPILGKIACGEPILADENISGYRYESPDMLPNGNVFFLQAKGDSMHPTIPSDSYVLIREQPEVEYGQIAAVLVNGDTEATLKRVKKQGDIVMLMPDNPEHEPFIVTPDNPAKIIGRAIKISIDL